MIRALQRRSLRFPRRSRHSARTNRTFRPEKFLKIFQKIEGREPANLFAKHSFCEQKVQKSRFFGRVRSFLENLRPFAMICVLRRLMSFCAVLRSAYSRRPIRDVGDLVVLLCVVFRPALSSSCSQVQSVPRVLFCAVFRSVYSFKSEFPCKARCASFLRKTYAIQVFCGDFVIRNFLRIVLFSFFIAIRFILSQFYCIPHSGSIMAFVAAVRQAVRRRC